MAELVLACALLAGVWWGIHTAWISARLHLQQVHQAQQVQALARDTLSCLRAQGPDCLNLPTPEGVEVTLSAESLMLAPGLSGWVLTARWTQPSGTLVERRWQAWVSSVPDALDVSLP